MIDFIKDLVETAKVSENHIATKRIPYGEMMAAMKNGDSSFCFDDLCEYMSDYMKKNRCSFSYVSDDTMSPVIVVKYYGFETDDKFNGAKF